MPPPLAVAFRRAVCLALLLTLHGALTGVDAREQSSPDLKAAFLLNFAKFVEWPAARRSFVVCIAGDADLEAAAERIIGGRSLGTRPIETRAITGADAGGCDLLYVSARRHTELPVLLQGVRGQPMLTVGEGAPFVRAGGIIGLFVEDQRMRFNVSAANGRAAGLQISSRLLALAAQ